jgi:hypothetical protein
MFNWTIIEEAYVGPQKQWLIPAVACVATFACNV